VNVEIDRQVAIDERAEATLPSQSELERWVACVLDAENEPRREVTIRFVERAESQQLNREYRGKDKPTNVLSFPFEAPPGLELPLLGDLVICHDVVVAEANEQRKSTRDHYAHLVIHGCLHLLGYDHIDDEEAEQMEALERALLARFDIADPYRADDSGPDV